MKRKLTSCLLVAGFMLATAPSAFATTYFIKVDGSDNTDGSSWEQAISYDYFAENMDQGNFADGDVFCFAGGVYKLSSPDPDKYLTINRSVTLLGGFDPNSTGTNTDITYPSPYETVISGAIESDVAAVPGNRTTLWLMENRTKDGDVTATTTRIEATVKGFTFKHSYRAADTSNSWRGAVIVANADVDMEHCKIVQNGAANEGGALMIIGATVNVSDCVFSENFSAGKGAALACLGSSVYPDKKSIAVVQRSQFTDNYFETTEYTTASLYNARGSAVFLGTDTGNMVAYLINCLVADNYTEGFGCINVYPECELYMISTTLANKTFTAKQRELFVPNPEISSNSRGVNLNSYGGHVYMANCYNVNEIVGEEGASSSVSVLAQYKGPKPGSWHSAGYNYSGLQWFCTSWATPRDRTQTPEIQAQTFLYLSDLDKETYTYADIFGDATFGDNGGSTETLIPATRMPSLTLDELNALKNEWSLPENIDLTVDQRGYKRAATTCVGAYDGDATSGITDLTNVSKVSVSTLGNGIFQVNGADTDVTVYNLSGNVVKVVPANDVIDLSSAAKGVYIMTVGGQAFKVIK